MQRVPEHILYFLEVLLLQLLLLAGYDDCCHDEESNVDQENDHHRSNEGPNEVIIRIEEAAAWEM